jgi:CO/xanthine dehydrogenase FAD-binding subunit
MDLNTVKSYLNPADSNAVRPWQAGDAWLAGGTWLFSEPQPDISTLIDLRGYNWPSLSASAEGLEIGATCTISELNDFIAPHEWIAAPLLKECCRSLLASFKIWNTATVGGNVCTALPAGAMISLTAALEGVCTLWPRHGAPRELPVIDFVTGNHQNALASGELLRSIWIPATALRKHYTLRRFSLTANGRSSVLLVGTLCPDSGQVILTITAATVRPVQLVFPELPSAKAVHMAINEHVPFDHYFEDPHGSPMHRRHLTYHYAEKILQELAMI